MAKKSKKILARFEHPQLSNASKTLLANIRFASVDEKVKTIVVTSDETLEALREPAMQIVDAVHNVLERTPPELAADIFDRGIVLTGGGSLLSGLDALIEEKTGIATMIAEDPLTAVAVGTGKFIEFEHEDDRGFFKR